MAAKYKFETWLNPLFSFGRKNTLTKDDIYDVMPEDETSLLVDKLQRAWETEVEYSRKKKKEPNFFKTTLLAFKTEYVCFGLILLLTVPLKITLPYLIGQMVDYFQPGSTMPPYEVYCIATALSINAFLRVMIEPWYAFNTAHLAVKQKAAVGGLIYRKVLKISSQSLHDTNTGNIVNHLSTDLDMFVGATDVFNYVWAGPLEAVITIFLIYRNVGFATLFMLPVLVCFVPVQGFFGRLLAKLRRKIATTTDRRIHMMNEVIVGMKIIKMYCWETPFRKLISKLRKSEINKILCAVSAKVCNACLFLSSSKLLCIPVFVSAWKIGIPLSSSVVFSTLGWIENLKLTIFFSIPYLVESNSQLYASLKRIKGFLLLEEKVDVTKQTNESKLVYVRDRPGDNAIVINNMTAIWTTASKSEDVKGTRKKDSEKSTLMSEEGDELCGMFMLNNIDLKVKPGELVAVIGAVGSGKSSLLLALLGEFPVKDGRIVVNGTVGYVSQQPWVITGTIKNNILFGEVFEEIKYQQVINACALDKDLKLMKHGDETLVGERGLMLSGGQKVRLTLARAIYREVDIYLLDDPLSAVDTEVGRHLFNKCICEYLKDKTRILVTHQLQYLRTVNKIIALKEGSVVSVCTYEELVSNNEDLFGVLADIQSEDEDEMQPVPVETKALSPSSETEEMEEEDKETGTVDWKVYRDYIAAGYPLFTVPVLLVLAILTQALYILGDWNLTKWTEYQDVYKLRNEVSASNSSLDISSAYTNVYKWISTTTSSYDFMTSESVTSVINITRTLSPTGTHNEYMYAYILSFGAYLVFVAALTAMSYTTLIIAGKRLHDRMFHKVFAACPKFFDTNPVGRILNRFARDIGLLDNSIPGIASRLFETGFRLIGLLITTCVINPILLIPLSPIVLFIIFSRNYALTSSRHLKRIEAVTKTPMYSHMCDTLHGLQTIRALDLNRSFIQEFDTYQNHHSVAAFLFYASYRWLSFRSLCGVLFYMLFVVVLSLILKDVLGLTGGMYGLSLTYVLFLAEPFEQFFRQSAFLESFMTSAERITAYTKLEQEENGLSDETTTKSWPTNGEIVFKNVNLKYSEESPVVLKDINCTIRGKEKVGIVGRTGAGKSSLLACLMRLAVPSGGIIIDGVNILTITLYELRSRISVIPQDPILFSGTIRQNLDPFEEFPDDKIWFSLQQVQLKSKIESLPGHLYAEVSAGGSNFSVGQKQLICLARALLRYNRILILDEATANVDQRTDEMIQTTIRERFQDCTVLTVAHRLHTVMDSDRLMVLDEGEVKEFDTPYNLLQKEESFFKRLVDQTGNSQAKQLKSLVSPPPTLQDGSKNEIVEIKN